MSIHPIETRYGLKRMKEIFSEEEKLNLMLKVESSIVKAHVVVKKASKDISEDISKKASTKYVTLDRVKQIEAEINHDVMAVVKALTEVCDENTRNYIHLGATSADITDTALSLQLVQATDIILDDLNKLLSTLMDFASKYKSLVCIGRTHGQHAIPMTFGMKFALWASEIDRHMKRIEGCKERVAVGKLTGAVGTMAALGEKAFEIQKQVMSELGLKPVLISNQVISRDSYTELVLILALIAETLNKIGIVLRTLQRPEIAEVEEYYDTKKQVGSSTMPHKRNPIHLERVCGLSRIIKSNAYAMVDNIALWDERDLTNSSPERIIFPEIFILCDYILDLMVKSLTNLKINEKSIEKNINLSKGLIFSEAVMVALVNKGLGRQDAHELLRKLASQAFESNNQFRDVLVNDKTVSSHLTEKEIEELLIPKNYIGKSEEIIDTVIRTIKSKV